MSNVPRWNNYCHLSICIPVPKSSLCLTLWIGNCSLNCHLSTSYISVCPPLEYRILLHMISCLHILEWSVYRSCIIECRSAHCRCRYGCSSLHFTGTLVRRMLHCSSVGYISALVLMIYLLVSIITTTNIISFLFFYYNSFYIYI